MRLDVEGHRLLMAERKAWVSVLVDGVDVTRRCREADDAEGWALCYKLDADGRRYVADHRPALERLTGKVEFVSQDERR